MTLSIDGVRLHASRRSRGAMFFVLAAEAVLSLFLYVSFAAHIVWPDISRAAAGVSPYLSYEGRLSDSSGNPLGGTGEPYCFRFSIYDSASGGTKLWPAGSPNVTVATTTDGVFSALVGQADALTYNFYDSDTVYLNVDVNTATSTNGSTCSGSWESLSPRQQVAATGYAQTAENVYSSLLKTNVSANRIDLGTGTGVSSPVLMALDWNNQNQYVGQTCSTSGTMWYNSAVSAALICEGGFIEELGTTGTTTIAGINANSGTPASAGTVVFSNGNGVSWGINGNTITASVNGGGTASSTVLGNNRGWAQGSVSLGQNSIYIFPERLNVAVAASAIKIPVMVTNSSSAFAAHTRGYTIDVGIYSRNATNSTVLTQMYSTSYTAGFSANSNGTWAGTIITGLGNSTSYNTVSASSAGLNLSTASFHGPREFILPLYSTLTAGDYWFAVRNSSSSAGAAGNLFNVSVIIASSQTGNPFGAASNVVSLGGIGQDIGLGNYSVTSAALPGGISMTQINRAATNPILYLVNATR